MVEPEEPGTQLMVVNQLLGSIAGDAQVEVSGWLGDYFRTRRLRSIARTLQKTHAILEDAGLRAHTVPLKTLSALLEGPSYEEDTNDNSMVDRWAALLARAASGGAEIPPGYVRTLADLTPRQAELLDRLYDNVDEQPHADTQEYRETGPNLADLERLGLIKSPHPPDEHPGWYVTTFGRHFVELCRPPVTNT